MNYLKQFHTNLNNYNNPPFVYYLLFNPDDIVSKSSYKKHSIEKVDNNILKRRNKSKTIGFLQNQKLTDSSKMNISRIEIEAIVRNNSIQNNKQNLNLQQLNSNTNPNAAFLAPYKNHPQFNYLQNQHTLDLTKVIQLRNPNGSKKDVTTLILKPQAMAIAGLEGTAIATPVARALVEKGTDVDIYFEPQAVAVAGPGGIAHAQSELEIGYIE